MGSRDIESIFCQGECMCGGMCVCVCVCVRVCVCLLGECVVRGVLKLIIQGISLLVVV